MQLASYVKVTARSSLRSLASRPWKRRGTSERRHRGCPAGPFPRGIRFRLGANGILCSEPQCRAGWNSARTEPESRRVRVRMASLIAEGIRRGVVHALMPGESGHETNQQAASQRPARPSSGPCFSVIGNRSLRCFHPTCGDDTKPCGIIARFLGTQASLCGPLRNRRRVRPRVVFAGSIARENDGYPISDQPFTCQQIVKFLSLSSPKPPINPISG